MFIKDENDKLWMKEVIKCEGIIFLTEVDKILVEKETKFQKIGLCVTDPYGKVLVIDDEPQSCQIDEFVYHESLIHPAMIMHPNPKKILILGAGEGATGRELLKHNTVEKIVAIDIDGEAIDFYKEHLKEWHQGSFDHPKYELHIMDAKDYIENCKEKFDVVICDLTDPIRGSPVRFLYTKEFYEKVKKVMNEDGILIMQAHYIDANPKLVELHCSERLTLNSVFGNILSLSAYIDSFKALWMYIIASSKEIKKIDVDKLLKERGVTGLKFYDQITHNRMSSQPKYAREFFKTKGRILTDKDPYNDYY